MRSLRHRIYVAHPGDASFQSDMEVMDEKVNGGPPLEVEEIVSVKDRTYTFSTQYRARSHSVGFVDDAFAAKHMPDLGHEVKEFVVYHWTIHNWKKLEKKITSQEFECGGHKW